MCNIFLNFQRNKTDGCNWVRACGRLDLEPKGPEYAHQNCRLCHSHFENKWYKINKVRARLHPDAVPTIFFGPGFQQQDNTASEQPTQQNEENVVKEKVDRNTCAEATDVAEMQVQENNSKAETSQTIVPIIVSEITQPSTSTIKKPAVRTKSSDDSPRTKKAQNKVMRETIRRLRMEKKKKATKVEEENEFDQLIKLGRKLLPEKFNRILAAQVDAQLKCKRGRRYDSEFKKFALSLFFLSS
ncbi:52 kDa repressor of the inhibitor of the protein kinase-like [Temnothorax curvispinosus]|uniref:52 kDa repressor of the inhibitor of the protein kinase-like n=1 Tax=Temnothorax curvispinosus TaxID=300111 RepID=A0A6J1QH43_9HYME|nr:52 kDa repressor of the inhibitor of the protein kinase-like [Temnothorax curvispinosus]